MVAFERGEAHEKEIFDGTVGRVCACRTTFDFNGCRQRRGRTEAKPVLVARATGPVTASTARCRVKSVGRELRLREGVFESRPQSRKAGHREGPDDFAGLVAGRLWQLRAVLYPHGVARRGDLPYG